MKNTAEILQYILKLKNDIIEKLKQHENGTTTLNENNIALLNGQKALIEELFKFIVGE